MSDKKFVVDTEHNSAERIKATSGRCPDCGEVHYRRITFLGDWLYKIEFISEQTYWDINIEQAIAKLN